MTFLPSLGSDGSSSEPQLVLEGHDLGLGLGQVDAQDLAIVAVGVGDHLLQRGDIVQPLAELAAARNERLELLVPAGRRRRARPGRRPRSGSASLISTSASSLSKSGSALEHQCRLRDLRAEPRRRDRLDLAPHPDQGTGQFPGDRVVVGFRDRQHQSSVGRIPLA